MNSQPPTPNSQDDAFHVPIEDAIDLHAFAPRDIPSVVEEYVRAAEWAADLGFHFVQRAIVRSALERLPLVEEFWDAAESHMGATVARLVNS